MNYLIVRSHPYPGSFNAGAADTISEAAHSKGHAVAEIDLVSDAFDPAMTAEDLKAWSAGKTLDPLVKKYQAQIEEADILVFSFPVWWGGPPAVLKGFCDKVLLPDWAYGYGSDGALIGLLTSKKAMVITTAEAPTAVLEDYGNPIEGAFIKNTLQECGIEVIRHLHIDRISSGGSDYAEGKMDEIRDLV